MITVGTIGLELAPTTTVGTTPVVLTIMTLAPNQISKCAHLYVVGVDVGGSGDMVSRELSWTAQRLGTGSAAIVGGVDSIKPKRVGTGISWATTISASGNDIILTLSGSTGLTVDWAGAGSATIVG